mgnify:CR=1 FL=1
MKKRGLKLSVIALVLVLILGGFLAYGYYQKATYKLQRPIVLMEIKDYGTVKIELYPDMAPNTVKNFIKLINEGYYNGLTFHRVEESLIQGGDTAGDGSGQSELSINGEFTKNGYDNTLKFERGTVGLARLDYTYYSSMDPSLIAEGYNSGYAQFFIMAQDVAEFDGYYCSFGKVIEGIEIVDKITKIETKVETDEETKETTTTTMPVNPPVISNITVETFGVEYGEPKTHETFDINTWFMKQYYGL